MDESTLDIYGKSKKCKKYSKKVLLKLPNISFVTVYENTIVT